MALALLSWHALRENHGIMIDCIDMVFNQLTLLADHVCRNLFPFFYFLFKGRT